MSVTIALAGDTMLGRGVANSLDRVAPADLVSPEIAELTLANNPARDFGPEALADTLEHPSDFAAGPRRPGVAHVDLRHGLPGWLTATIAASGADTVPLRLGFAHTERATGEDRAFVVGRLTDACVAFGTRVEDAGDRLVLRGAHPDG